MKPFVITLALTLSLSGTLAAQPQHEAVSKPQPSSQRHRTPKGTSPTSEVLATYSLGTITTHDLDRVAGIELARARMQVYQLETKLIKQIVSERLLRFEALKEGKTRDQLYAERVTDRIVEPPKKRVDELLQKYGSRLKGTPKEKRREIIQALKQQQVRLLEDQLQATLLHNAKLKIKIEPPRFPVAIDQDDPTMGPANAPVTIVEFTDFQCPYCARAAKTIRTLLKQHRTTVRLVFKAAPSPSHPQGVPAAEAAFCAGAQGHFWAFYDWAFAHQDQLNKAAFLKEATVLGLKKDAFQACLTGHTMLQKVRAGQRLAREIGITGTPTFFVNGRMLAGAQPASTFESLINAELTSRPHEGSPRLNVHAPEAAHTRAKQTGDQAH